MLKPLPTRRVRVLLAVQQDSRIVDVPRSDSANKQDSGCKTIILQMEIFRNETFKSWPVKEREIEVIVAEIGIDKDRDQVRLWKRIFRRIIDTRIALPLRKREREVSTIFKKCPRPLTG